MSIDLSASFNFTLNLFTDLGHDRLAKVYLAPVDLAPGETPPWSQSGSDASPTATGGQYAIAFQYWPESLSDSRQIEWSQKNIPGGSHPIYQWTQSGERSISFTAMFATDSDVQDPAEQDRYNLDLRAVVSWLRWFTYPLYKQGDASGQLVYAPPKCLLTLPGSGIGYDGGDSVLCVMTSCDITYQAFFPSGKPRILEVSLAFSEVVQRGNVVKFHDRAAMVGSASIASHLKAK